MSNNTSSSHSNYNLKQQVQVELLRQARWNHILALVATAATFSIALVGAAGVMFGRVQEGTATAATGLLGTVHSSQLSKEANERLEKLLAEQKKS